MGIIVQLSAEMLTTLFAMMQRAQGPQRQFVSVYNVPHAEREKEAGNRRMWSDPVKVKHWEWAASLQGVRRTPPPLGTTRTTMCTRLQCLRVTVGGPISVLSPEQA